MACTLELIPMEGNALKCTACYNTRGKKQPHFSHRPKLRPHCECSCIPDSIATTCGIIKPVSNRSCDPATMPTFINPSSQILYYHPLRLTILTSIAITCRYLSVCDTVCICPMTLQATAKQGNRCPAHTFKITCTVFHMPSYCLLEQTIRSFMTNPYMHRQAAAKLHHHTQNTARS